MALPLAAVQSSAGPQIIGMIFTIASAGSLLTRVLTRPQRFGSTLRRAIRSSPWLSLNAAYRTRKETDD